MSSTRTAAFDTRREAEMAVERLVQELGVERTDILVTTEGAENSAGATPSGSDDEAGSPSPQARDDGALSGKVVVSVDVQDDAMADKIEKAFEEFDGASASTGGN